MKVSTDRILTTHVGSLPRPQDVVDFLFAQDRGDSYDPVAFEDALARAVADRVARQADAGIDMVSDGEMSKISYLLGEDAIARRRRQAGDRKAVESGGRRMRVVAVVLAMAAAAGPPVFAQVQRGIGMDMTGEWAPRFHEDQPERIPGPEIGDYLGIPINEAARLHADSWDASILTLPEHQCKPHPSDYSPRGPANLRIWKEIDTVSQQLIAYHTHISWQAPERTIWMDGRPHPPDHAAHTWQGFSTGKWEGDMLTITTTHLKLGWIRRNGIPRSDKAVVTEHLVRHGDYLTWIIVIDDPVYLTEPFIRTTNFVADPHQQIAAYPCQIVEEIERPQGFVPHHLPGKNPFLVEFPAKFGVPPAAARGGAETMYPEYQEKIKAGRAKIAASNKQ